MALSPAEQKRAARTQKARTFLVFLRPIRPALLDADWPQTLAQSARPAPGGKAPVAAGGLGLATLWQAYGHVREQDAVERTVMAKRWQMGVDGLGAAPPPCSRGTLCHCRRRLLAPHLAQTWLERPVARAAQTGGGGARPRRAALDVGEKYGAYDLRERVSNTRSFDRRGGGLVPPSPTFPQAPRSSRTVGVPASGWQPGMWGSSRNAAFPYAWRLTCTLTYTPPTSGFLHRSPAAPFTTSIEPTVSCGVTDLAIPVPRAPAPPWGVPPPRGVSPRPRPAFPGPRRSSGLLRQPSTLSRPTHAGLVRESLPVAACPLLDRGPSRGSLLHLCGGAWPRPPPRCCGAQARCFPPNLGLTLRARGAAR